MSAKAKTQPCEFQTLSLSASCFLRCEFTPPSKILSVKDCSFAAWPQRRVRMHKNAPSMVWGSTRTPPPPFAMDSTYKHSDGRFKVVLSCIRGPRERKQITTYHKTSTLESLTVFTSSVLPTSLAYYAHQPSTSWYQLMIEQKIQINHKCLKLCQSGFVSLHAWRNDNTGWSKRNISQLPRKGRLHNVSSSLTWHVEEA